jgi:hypothetical protein
MTRPRRSAVVALWLCAVLLLRASPVTAQESTSTTRSRLTTTSVEQTEGDGDDGLTVGNKALVLIVGLVVLALVLIVFTWRYWRATKPARVSAPSDAAAAAPSPPARKSAPTI